MKVRIALLKIFYRSCQVSKLVGFSKTKIELSTSYIIQRNKFLLDFISHADKILGTIA